MELSPSSRGRGAKAFSLLLAAGLASGFLSVTASAQPPNQPPAAAPSSQPTPPTEPPLSAEERQKREEWQRAMSQVPVPKKGCFNSAYPSLEWREVPCGAPSKYPNPPAGGARPNIVGNGNDITAVVAGPMISSPTGSFDSVTPAGVTISGPWGGNPNAANAFTLQINSQFFTTPACAGVAGCVGWQQFIYSQNQCGGPCVFMEYWLINFGPVCPAGQPWMQAGNSCWFNSASTNAPAITAAQLQGTTLTGTAGAVNDTVVLTSPGGGANAMAADNVVSLSLQWNTAEFNIFGDCCSTQTNFSAGTTVVTRTRVINGTNNPPTCVAQGFTAETNNLSFGPAAPVASAPGPAVIFTSSSAGGAASNCAAATTIGDTHLTTFGGLLYDFQAAGDFLLAETGSAFVVQTRQVSGKPTWPNATVNKAVAVQAGKHRVAICVEPSRVAIDGKSVSLRDGVSVQLPGGGDVLRRGNVYTVRGPSGDSIRAVDNTKYIDVSVGLGRWPSNVRGLLANAGQGNNSIATSNGIVLTSPFSYDALYGHFTEGWRVPAKESMLSACGREAERGVPKKLFFAKDLDPRLAGRTRAICLKAGVKEGPLLDACTLDVAVIGNSNAAKVFATTPSPVVVGHAR
jgi:hypothetical protein